MSTRTATSRGVIGANQSDAAVTSSTKSSMISTAIAHIHGGASSLLGDITSFLSNGFRINWSLNNAVSDKLRYLCIKGGNFKVDVFNQSATNNADTTGGLPFVPVGEIYLSNNNVSSASIQNHTRISIGATDGTNQNCIWVGDQNAAGVTITN